MEDGSSAAERLYDAANAQGERERKMYMRDALSDLVQRVMRGERYPKSGLPTIDLWDFLDQQADVTELLAKILTSKDVESSVGDVVAWIEKRLRDHLVGSQFQIDRAEELAEEAREERML